MVDLPTPRRPTCASCAGRTRPAGSASEPWSTSDSGTTSHRPTRWTLCCHTQRFKAQWWTTARAWFVRGRGNRSSSRAHRWGNTTAGTAGAWCSLAHRTGAAGEHVVGQVEHVIRLVIRQMDLQQFQIGIDLRDQAEPGNQTVHREDPTERSRLDVTTDPIVDLPRGEHWSGLPTPMPRQPVASLYPCAAGVPRLTDPAHAISSSPQGPFRLDRVGAQNPDRIRPLIYPQAKLPHNTPTEGLENRRAPRNCGPGTSLATHRAGESPIRTAVTASAV